jgi:hypothetical protein
MKTIFPVSKLPKKLKLHDQIVQPSVTEATKLPAVPKKA